MLENREHSFNIDLAKEIGIEASIIYKHIRFWVEKNKANEKHFYNGRYWTYNSVKAFLELFPYMTRHKINKCLDDLESKGLLVSGNFNPVAYDRTKWYSIDFGKAFPENKKSISDNQTNHLLKNGNGFTENMQPIPYINTDSNTDINTDKETSLFSDDLFSDLKEKNDNTQKSCAKKGIEISFDEFKDLWISYVGKKLSVQKEYKTFLSKMGNHIVDIENLKLEAVKHDNTIYFQSWINKFMPKSDPYFDLMLEVIKYLNDRRKTVLPNSDGYEIVDSNLKHLKARIKEGYTFDSFKKVIDCSVIKWGKKPDLIIYIRPSTLFGDKFSQYLTESDAILSRADNGGNNFKEVDLSEPDFI